MNELANFRLSATIFLVVYQYLYTYTSILVLWYSYYSFIKIYLLDWVHYVSLHPSYQIDVDSLCLCSKLILHILLCIQHYHSADRTNFFLYLLVMYKWALSSYDLHSLLLVFLFSFSLHLYFILIWFTKS